MRKLIFAPRFSKIALWLFVLALLLLCFGAVFAQDCPCNTELANSAFVRVYRVIDADTVDFRVSDLLGKTVLIVRDRSASNADNFGQLLRTVCVDGQDFGEMLRRENMIFYSAPTQGK